MALVHQPDISAHDDVLQLAILAGYPKRVLEAIISNPNIAAAIVADEREKMWEVLDGTPNLANLIDTHTIGMHGRKSVADIKKELDTAVTTHITDPSQPLLDPKGEIKKAFDDVNTHVHVALRKASESVRPTPIAPTPKSPEEIRNEALESLLSGEPTALLTYQEAVKDLKAPETGEYIDFWKQQLNKALDDISKLSDPNDQKRELLRLLNERNNSAKLLRKLILDKRTTTTTP